MSSNLPLHGLLALAFTLLQSTPSATQEPADPSYELRSPDRRLVVTLNVPSADRGAAPRWSASLDGRPLLTDCRLGWREENGDEPFTGAQVTAVNRARRDARISVLFGKADHAFDRAEELSLTLQRDGASPVRLVFRCYDDAVAFRYEALATEGHDALRIAAELTSFGLVESPTVYTSFLENFRTSHEYPVREVAFDDLPVGQLLDTPLTAAYLGGPFLSITEAALLRYAGMSLRRDETSGQLIAALSPSDDGIAVESTLPMLTPWRVVLIGDTPGALLESQTLYCLNEAPDFDPSWIRPGKMTWPWWNHYHFEAEPAEPILSLAASRRHIDWCVENGIAFHAIVADETDTPWYRQSRRGLFPGPDTDATQVREDLDLAAIRAYADERDVRLWTWVFQTAIRGRVEEAFTAFERFGWDGIMVDFLDRDDQATVEFAEEVLRAAARHRMLVHFHGMYKPTGWQRTFPHLMNHEGSLNLEYLKWTALCTPEHTLRVAFTRLVAGPMDYHLGGFRAVLRSDFVPKNAAPNVLGSRGHQLAMYVVFDNPAPMVADYPAAYRDQPGFDFLREVPTWWDETQVLDAEIGRLLLTARRKGVEWWLGGLAAGATRDLEVPLTFLGTGGFMLRLWRDGDEVASDPNQLFIEERRVEAGDTLRVRVGADGGGFTARIRVID